MDPNFNMDINDTSSFKDEDVTNDIIKVIGVGGGGGNAVNYMYKQQIPHIQFVVCNTDKQALDRSEVPKHVLLGYDITKGLGAGNVPEVGRKCAESSEEEIRALFDDKTEMVFITATMGGGTYARHFPYAVSFGPEHVDLPLPEFGGPMHGANEAAPIDKLLEAVKIYILALLRLEEIDF